MDPVDARLGVRLIPPPTGFRPTALRGMSLVLTGGAVVAMFAPKSYLREAQTPKNSVRKY